MKTEGQADESDHPFVRPKVPRCVRCGGEQLCSFCVGHGLDERRLLPESAEWVLTKGMCVNGVQVQPLGDR